MTEKEMIEIKHGSENMCDLLNQEQAELKKAMIEELGHTLYCKQDKFDLSNPFEVAKAVVEEGYYKVPKGAVVLTKEEFFANNEKCYQQARKETAREIIQLLDGHQFEDDGWTWSVSKRDLKFIAKKYGVEIEGGNKND